MPEEELTSEEIKLRRQEDRYIQEGKKDYERIDRARAVSEARQERLKKTPEQIKPEKLLKWFSLKGWYVVTLEIKRTNWEKPKHE